MQSEGGAMRISADAMKPRQAIYEVAGGLVEWVVNMSKLHAKSVRDRGILGGRDKKASVVAKDTQPASANVVVNEDELRHAMIAERAYYLAEARGFEQGRELDDWLTAEGEVERMVPSNSTGGSSLCGDSDLTRP
jgi:Protein of unknown function (DUF2934)